MDADALIVLAILIGLVSAPIGGFVAASKRRPVAEGVALGLLLGFLGLAIEAMLPAGASASGPAGSPIDRAIRAGHVAWLAGRYREALDAPGEGWRGLPPKRLKAMVANVGEECRAELGVGRSEFKDLSAEALASLRAESDRPSPSPSPSRSLRTAPPR